MSDKGFTHESTHNESKEWYTPPEVFEALGLTFNLDPCAPVGGVPWIPVKHFLALPINGLKAPWFGKVWMNPPYGQDTPEWLQRFILHGNGIALVFARTDTEWFHHWALKADALLFTRGRIRFIKPDGTRAGTPGAGSLFVACGAECVRALKNSKMGFYVGPETLQKAS